MLRIKVEWARLPFGYLVWTSWVNESWKLIYGPSLWIYQEGFGIYTLLAGFDAGVKARPAHYDLWAVGLKPLSGNSDRLEQLCKSYLP